MSTVELARTVRFCVSLASRDALHAPNGSRNTFAASPAMKGLGAFYELTVRCAGVPDPQTGYLISVSTIDQAVRSHAVPRIAAAVVQNPDMEPAELLPEIINALRERLPGPRLVSVEWRLTPFYAVTMDEALPGRVLLTDRFEFAAAHRLHAPELSDEENQRCFGRCNNPSGHGHNYQVEVAVSLALTSPGTPQTTPRFSLVELEAIVMDRVIQRFDHKHLNLDTEEFRSLNPTVEHLAVTCYRLLEGPMADAGARLERVTIWETEKTSCSFSRNMA